MSIPAIIGFITGLASQITDRAWKYIRAAAIAAVIIVVLPSVTEFWLRHTRIPEVPVSAIVLLLAGSLFMLAFAAMLYTVCTCLKGIQLTERTVVQTQAARARKYKETDGYYGVTTEHQAWQNEQINTLRAQGIRTDSINNLAKDGILTEDDRRAIEEMAEAAALRNRGRTE